MSVILGAIADDFTGATDLANTLVGEGVSTVQVIGVPSEAPDLAGVEAVVVALKSRTAPTEDAVNDSLAALRWLQSVGAEQIIFKYCSTFDSTANGNIGPVADALLTEMDEKIAVICPAFPANARTVYKGTLFVGDVPLAESPMKDHPLTPMRDSSLIRLMQEQSQHTVGLVPLEIVRAGPEHIMNRIEMLVAEGHRYGVVDALNGTDLRLLGSALAQHGLVTGGSGVATGLPSNLRALGLMSMASEPVMPLAQGRALVIAGSCSTATRAQIAWAKDHWPTRKIDIDRVAAGEAEAEDVIAWVNAQSGDTPVLVYGSADPGEVADTQARYGKERAGALMEDALASVARTLHEQGFDRLVVAGGETSGAVVSALGVTALRIGPEIAPGVPWTEALDTAPLALALKSGNFGGPEFFREAIDLLAT